ncbi:stage III sporulation protein AG [Robertmurraya sp. P23]|uniref:stage III sporulation protein AG n=1 Tax=Robertmurraya sp. P23 TaxID=3436931 RepID=UPI000E6B048A|nr:stage III sporulation protein AG [Bacillus sp. Y1]AYA76983.1 stage III sporulation protein AG [Bacillus sp. Y1]
MENDTEKDKEPNNDKGPITFLKKLFSKDSPPEKKSSKYQYFLIVLLIGAAIMLASNLLINPNPSPSAVETGANAEESSEDVETFGQKKIDGNEIIAAYEDHYENQLKETLEGIVGVGEVIVAVNVDATEKKILEKNVVVQSQKTEEVDREGGQRTVEDQSKDEQLVIIRDGEKEVPIVIETKKPAIRGVIVIAKGADNIQVKKWILESVTKLLDVPVHRVSVMPKK